jgi:hypothetical protein
MPHGIEADGVHAQCIFDGAGYFVEREGLQQPKHLDVLPAPVIPQAHFQ